uniref:Zinc finger protein 544 n=1 Tax=Piliocolobus tephrosceles TaxID=591936 RepID=A0A8C9GNQ8_9PRIM
MEACSKLVPPQASVCFEDVAMAFTQEEWEQLDLAQRTLYQEVTLETWEHIVSLGLFLSKSDVISQLKQEEDLCRAEQVAPREKEMLGSFLGLPIEDRFGLLEGCLIEFPQQLPLVQERGPAKSREGTGPEG